MRENFKENSNITIIETAIFSKDVSKKFYSIKRSSISKLKKHWASGIGSFSKEHILNHKSKRFNVSEEDIEEIIINCLSFSSLVKKFNITGIKKLMLDVEGAEYDILNSIDYNNCLIEKIIFEKKHLDGTFTEGNKLKNLKKLLENNNYKLTDIDIENILAEKLSLI